jgi:hypothetical protein
VLPFVHVSKGGNAGALLQNDPIDGVFAAQQTTATKACSVNVVRCDGFVLEIYVNWSHSVVVDVARYPVTGSLGAAWGCRCHGGILRNIYGVRSVRNLSHICNKFFIKK